MCLVTRQRKPRITKRDLVVYKVINVNYLTKAIHSRYFPEFIWRKGKMEETKLDYSRTEYNSAERFDREVDNKYCKGNFGSNNYEIITEVGRGFHATKTRKRLMECGYSWESIMKFLIPKGSEVFTDITGLIVSNQMMML